MKRNEICLDLNDYPQKYHTLLDGSKVYDSSCSQAARVYFIDRDGGYFLKSAPAGTLDNEAAMTRFLHDRGLAAEVLHHERGPRDWLLTRRIPGEDCTHPMYTADPARLSALLGSRMQTAVPMTALVWLRSPLSRASAVLWAMCTAIPISTPRRWWAS